MLELALWARLQSGPKLKTLAGGRSSMARTPLPLGGVAFALALTSCARAGLLLAPIFCLARAITPRALSADRLRSAIGADTKHAPISELSRSVWLQRGQKCASCA